MNTLQHVNEGRRSALLRAIDCLGDPREGLKRAVRDALARAGLSVTRRTAQNDPLRFLGARDLRCVLDIGANTGQFAQRARRLFPGAMIHAFEPVPGPFAELLQLATRDHRLRCHNLALGEEDGDVTLEVNGFTPASSLLPLAPLTAEAYPYTAHTSPQRVRMTTLDRWAAQLAESLPRPLLIKMDVQGYEDRVVSGGAATFACASVVLSEVSFQPLYQGQVLFDELHARLRSAGFRCAGFLDAALDPRSDRPLYADAIFLRE